MRLLLLLTLSITLSGCAGMLAGHYNEEPVKNTDGTIAKTAYGTVIKSKKRTARSVAIMESAAEAVGKIPSEQKTNPCLTLSFEQLNQLKADAQAAYMNGANMCAMMYTVQGIVSQSLGRPQSVHEAVAKQFVGAVVASEQGLTGRVKAIANPLAFTIGVKSIATSFENVGKAKGNTSVGDINLGSSSQHGSASGDGAISSPDRSGDTSTNVVIGDNNKTNTAFDNGVANSANYQQLESSATGNINDGKQQGVTTADENEGTNSVQDDDGLNF